MTKPRFTQYFRGSLSGLTIRPGTIESQKVISCLQACKEGLDINSLESLDKGIKVCILKHVTEAQTAVTGLTSVNLKKDCSLSEWTNVILEMDGNIIPLLHQSAKLQRAGCAENRFIWPHNIPASKNHNSDIFSYADLVLWWW